MTTVSNSHVKISEAGVDSARVKYRSDAGTAEMSRLVGCNTKVVASSLSNNLESVLTGRGSNQASGGPIPYRALIVQLADRIVKSAVADIVARAVGRALGYLGGDVAAIVGGALGGAVGGYVGSLAGQIIISLMDWKMDDK